MVLYPAVAAEERERGYAGSFSEMIRTASSVDRGHEN